MVWKMRAASKLFLVSILVLVSPVYALKKEVNEIFNRPVVKHNVNFKYQPYQEPHRFLNMGSGVLLYSYNDTFKTAVPAIIVGCLKAETEDLRGYDDNRNGMGRHSWKGYELDSDSMVVKLGFGSYSDDILSLNNKHQSLVISQKTTFKRECKLRAVGYLMKLPCSLWEEGYWQIGTKRGVLEGEVNISVDGAGRIAFEQHNGAKVEIEFGSEITEVKINKNKRLLDNYEVYFVTSGDLDGNLVTYKGCLQSSFELKLSGDFFDPVIDKDRIGSYSDWDWTEYDGKELFDWRFDDQWLEKNLQYQILDSESEFYGMFIPDNQWTDIESMQTVILPTRDLLDKASSAYENSQSKYYKNKVIASSIEAALDYVCAAIDRQSGQIGEVRSKAWAVKPFAWGISPYSKAIWVMRKNRCVSNERIAYWLSCFEYLWRRSSFDTALHGYKEGEVGWNQASKVITAAKYAEFLGVNDKLPFLKEAMFECMKANSNPVWGIKSDYSLREHSPTFFDVKYFSNLYEDICEWYDKYKGSELCFDKEYLDEFDNISESIYWLYDNGILTNITGDNRCRLCRESSYAFYLTKDYKESADIIYRQIRSRQEGNSVAVDDNALDKGFRWYYNPGLAIARTDNYYFAAVAKAGNITCSSNSWNYNAKVPVGGFYMRSAHHPREIAIPSDNVNFAGVTLVEGMEDYKDADNEFMNNKNSRKIDFINNQDYALFGMEGHISAMTAPKDELLFYKTYFLLGEFVVAVQYVPAQEIERESVVYPLVLSTPDDKIVKVNNKQFDIKSNNQETEVYKLGNPDFVEFDTVTMVCLEQPTGLELYDWSDKGYRLEGIGQWSEKQPTQMAKLQTKLDTSKSQSYVWAYVPRQDSGWHGLLEKKKLEVLSSTDVHFIKTGNCLMVAKYNSDIFSTDDIEISGSGFVLISKDDKNIRIVISSWEDTSLTFKSDCLLGKSRIVRGKGDCIIQGNKITLQSCPDYHYYQNLQDLKPLEWRNKTFEADTYVDKQKIPFEIVVSLD